MFMNFTTYNPWHILVFVFQIQCIHGMSMGYDHIVYILTYIWTSVEILTDTTDTPSMCKGHYSSESLIQL